MTNRVLMRPEVKRKQSRPLSSRVLPVNLTAAYACYHTNLAEQKKLEHKLHVIDLEENQMKKDFQHCREELKREMRQNENYFWNCHRVFSAATLITESDSYKQSICTGPRPTKAKLPRKTLQRLDEFVKKLRAEDDLDTFNKFQQFARFGRRGAHLPPSSTSTVAAKNDLDLYGMQGAADLMNKVSAHSMDSSVSNFSGKVLRASSAPSRVASESNALADCQRNSPLPWQRSKRVSDVTPRYSFSKVKETRGGLESPTTKLAWAEEKSSILNGEVLKTCSEEIGESFLSQSHDNDFPQEKGSPWLSEKSCDIKRWVACANELLATAEPSKECREPRAVYAELPSSDATFNFEQGKLRADESKVEKLLSDSFETRKGTFSPPIVQKDTLPQEEAVTPAHLNKQGSNNLGNLQEQKTQEAESLSKMHSTEEAHFEETGCPFVQPSEIELGDIKQMKQGKENKGDTKYIKTVEGTGRSVESCNRNTTVPKAQPVRNTVTTITFPKSDLQGLSSQQKILTPRTKYKTSRIQNDTSNQKFETQRDRVMSPRAIREHNRESLVLRGSCNKYRQPFTPRTCYKDLKLQNDGCLEEKEIQKDKRKSPNKSTGINEAKKDSQVNGNHRKCHEKAPNRQRKRRVSIFKQKCLPELLHSAQTKIESQLRNKVQGFLGAPGDMESAKDETEQLE